MNESFQLKPVESKGARGLHVVVVVYEDARVSPRVEKIIGKYAGVRQRQYVGVEDRYGVYRDRVAVYILENVENIRLLKSALKNMEIARDIEVIIKTY
jgi:hypothetical protein